MANRKQVPAWLWLNLLSLDAPLIALVWQDFLARCYPAMLLPAGRAVLGLTVWAIYLTDRLLDVRHSAQGTETVRRSFYRRHCNLLRLLLILVLSVNALVAWFWLRPEVFDSGLLVTMGVVVYLVAFTLGRWREGSLKKLFAASLFTSGIFLITWIGTAQPGRKLMWPAAAFFGLCLGNLLMIEKWSRGEKETARGWICLVLLCLFRGWSENSRWFSAVIISAGGLGVLAFRGRTIPRDARCVLADAVLLSPLLFR